MDRRTNRFKRKQLRRPWGIAAGLGEKVNDMGGRTGFALENDPTSDPTFVTHDPDSRSAGIFGQRAEQSVASSAMPRTRLFQSTPRGDSSSTTAARSVGASTASRRSRFSRVSMTTAQTSRTTTTAVHVVCAISENLARETCVTSLDAGSPTTIQIAKQGNGNTYAETLAYLEILKPDEVLLNEGRRNSQLARKVMELYNVQYNPLEHLPEVNRRQRRRRVDIDEEDAEAPEDDRYGSLENATVVKFISRSCFDQTKGAELLQKISREETYDATVVEEYILLSSAFAVLNYTQQTLGASFAKNSVTLNVNSSGNNRMSIDRSTLLQLELLVNSKTGKVRNSLIGTIDCTKTTVGSRLLRTNIMSPPMRCDTVNARLDLVDLFMRNEDFFFTILEHLQRLPDIDKMLSNIALVPRKSARMDGEKDVVPVRVASKGIAALVYMKTTLQALPSLAGVLESLLRSVESQETGMDDDATIVTDRSSLLVGLGGGKRPESLNRHHLLRAIIFAMQQPALGTVLDAVSDIFTESTTAMRNANAMRHQECFAFKCEESSMMSLLRRAFLSNVDDIYKKADEYAEVYGITAAIRYSNGRGYYLAIPADSEVNMPEIFLQPSKSGRFINCTTEEITSLSNRASDNVQDLLLMTHDRIQEVMGIARSNYDAIATLCDSVALLDMCHSFADHCTVSSEMPWCRPIVTEGNLRPHHRGANSSMAESSYSSSIGSQMMIRKGHYPIQVSELASLVAGDGSSELVPNDTFATDEKPFTVITGINGSGKTTYLKQIATITILAHCGMYVPAEQATIPMRDRLCCRLGNADDQEHNISTFMLEMKETAYILNNATDRALVLVDELGRATSNEDGVAIAWATSEYLLKKRAMTFFVTHYPQLACLASIYPSVQNLHMEASVSKGSSNANGEISYTHKVKMGACTVSTDYGIELAAACGWPPEVVDDARKTEGDIASLLSNESVCHEHNRNSHDATATTPNATAATPNSNVATAGSRTKAFKLLGTLVQDLKGLITDDRVQSYPGIRKDLVELQQNRVGSVDHDIVAAMDSLLFRESRQEYCRRIGQIEEQVYRDNDEYSDELQQYERECADSSEQNYETRAEENIQQSTHGQNYDTRLEENIPERDEAEVNSESSDDSSDASTSSQDSSISSDDSGDQ